MVIMSVRPVDVNGQLRDERQALAPLPRARQSSSLLWSSYTPDPRSGRVRDGTMESRGSLRSARFARGLACRSRKAPRDTVDISWRARSAGVDPVRLEGGQSTGPVRGSCLALHGSEAISIEKYGVGRVYKCRGSFDDLAASRYQPGPRTLHACRMPIYQST